MASSASQSSTALRRTLTRQYKESLRPMGVFAVRNLIDGRSLVVGSLDLDAAMNRLRFELRRNGHRNKLLQADFNRHGEPAFEFAVLQRLQEREDSAHDYAGELEALREIWLAELDCIAPRGYNDCATARNGGGL